MTREAANAGLPRRLGAMLYDGLLVIAVAAAASLPVVAISGDAIAPGTLYFQLLLLAVIYAFYVGFWYRYGRTLGMQTWRLQIESADGGQPTFLQCSARFLFAIVSWIPFGLGFLWQLIDRDRLTWHDRLSRTRLRYTPKTPPGDHD